MYKTYIIIIHQRLAWTLVNQLLTYQKYNEKHDTFMKYPCKSIHEYNIVTIDRRETIKYITSIGQRVRQNVDNYYKSEPSR